MKSPKSMLLWLLSAVALFLLVASLTGNGSGIGGSGFFTHMVWSYIFGLVILALVIWQIPGPSHRREGRIR